MRRKFLPIVTLFAHALLQVPIGAQTAKSEPRFAFQGKLLIVACDTDMLPSAYIDGKLGPTVGPDVLSVINLGQHVSSPAKLRTSSVEVTNSVTGPPAAVAVTPDGHYAIIAETQGKRPPGKADVRMSDLAPGKKLTIVSLANPDKPVVVQQIESYERPVSVAVNAAGNTVAVAFAAKSHSTIPIVLFPFANGKLGKGVEPALPGYTLTDELTDAEFLPGGASGEDVIGITFGSSGYSSTQRARLGFFTVQGSALQPWGNVLEVDPSPYLIKFTSDGRFALVNSMHNFADVRGTVTSIHLNEATDAKGESTNVIASRVEAGQFPEGLAVSPDGRWVATANLETSALPLSDPGQKFYGSVSLLRMDPKTGILNRIGEFPFDGMLPEPIVFDNSSRFLAVGNFSQYDDLKAGGAMEFFRISEDNPQPGRVELIHLRDSVPLSRGPESMAIVR